MSYLESKIYPFVTAYPDCTVYNYENSITKYNYTNGDTFWFKGDLLHCLEGPAKIFDKGTYKQWWINGEQIECSTQEEFERIIKIKAFI